MITEAAHRRLSRLIVDANYDSIRDTALEEQLTLLRKLAVRLGAVGGLRRG
jgi:hypothetical protein